MMLQLLQNEVRSDKTCTTGNADRVIHEKFASRPVLSLLARATFNCKQKGRESPSSSWCTRFYVNFGLLRTSRASSRVPLPLGRGLRHSSACLFGRQRGKLPPHHVEIHTLDFFSYLWPLVVLADSALRGVSRGFAHSRIRYQKSQAVGQIRDVSIAKSEPCIINGLPVFGHIASQNTKARPHRVQQCQRQTFQIGGQHEHHCIRQQLL